MTHPTDERAAVCANRRDDELCANCGYTFAGHISNTGCVHPDWKPLGRYATPPTASAPPREEGPRQQEQEGWTKKSAATPPSQPQEPKLHTQPTTREGKMAKGEWQSLDPAERSRTYTYAGGEVLTYTNVSRVKVSESGTV